MIELKAEKPRPRIVRKVVFAVLAVAILGVAGLQNAGYAVLIATGAAGDVKNGMVQVSCTYFTGTEKVISHVTRSASNAGGSGRCAIITRLPKLTPPLGDLLTK